MKFVWDAKKALSNIQKHGVSFDLAVEVFGDYLSAIFSDTFHSITEYREIIIGKTKNQKLLVVVFVEIDDNIRIISARPATNKERKDYENNRTQY